MEILIDLPHETLLPIAFLIAFVSVWWIHPWLVRLAQHRNIVDSPDARKLQRVPVPLLGGIAVFFGLFLGTGTLSTLYDSSSLLLIFMVLTVMLYIGTIDDVLNLSPYLRFASEIFCVLFLILFGDLCIVNFHGLWGLHAISLWIAIPLTLFISVGIINSVNLIDGVDGLSTGFCILACTVFSSFFSAVGDESMTMLTAVAAGALIPFFLHNVFGKTSRMFIGDGGALVMGMLMAIFVMRVLSRNPHCVAFASEGMGLIPFTMAVLSIPVFDTVRVMTMRISRGVSPFLPDKTHLHHLFIDLGFSHAGTTLNILMINSLVVAAWYISFRLGASIDCQLYIVITLSLLFTFGFYLLVTHLNPQNPLYRFLRHVGTASHFNRKGFFLWMRRVVDNRA